MAGRTIATQDGRVPHPRETTQLEAEGSRAAGHFAQPARFLRSLRLDEARRERGADVELRLGSDTDRVHSAVIAAHSHFFGRLLANEEPPLTVDLAERGLTANALRKAVDFMYTGSVAVTIDSLAETLNAAAQLDMPALRRLLERYLRQVSLLDGYSADCANVCTALPVAAETRRYVLHNAARHFKPGSPATQRLTADALFALLINAHLAAPHETYVFNAVLAWLQADAERAVHTDRLLDCVRFAIMNTAQLLVCAERAKGCHTELKRNVQARLAAAGWHHTCVEQKEPRLTTLADSARRNTLLLPPPPPRAPSDEADGKQASSSSSDADGERGRGSSQTDALGRIVLAGSDEPFSQPPLQTDALGRVVLAVSDEPFSQPPLQTDACGRVVLAVSDEPFSQPPLQTDALGRVVLAVSDEPLSQLSDAESVNEHNKYPPVPRGGASWARACCGRPKPSAHEQRGPSAAESEYQLVSLRASRCG